jgi:hypothetical protein
MLVCTRIVSALAGAFHYAAFDSSYAMLVPDRLLPRANGMMQMTWWSSGIVSPGLAALVITLPALVNSHIAPSTQLSAISNGVALCIAANALTFFLSAAWSSSISRRIGRRAASPMSPLWGWSGHSVALAAWSEDCS